MPTPTAAASEYTTPELHGSYPPTYHPRVLAMCTRRAPVPARCASMLPVPALGTQQVVLPLLLRQQLAVVRTARLILHAHHVTCAGRVHHMNGMHAQRVHVPR